jgi:hypothetical protein
MTLLVVGYVLAGGLMARRVAIDSGSFVVLLLLWPLFALMMHVVAPVANRWYSRRRA